MVGVSELTLLDSAEWERLVGQSPWDDVYFRPSYFQIFKNCGVGLPRLIRVECDGWVIAHAFMLRPIPTFGRGVYSDITTPYGYGGPILVSGPHPVPNHVLLAYRRAMLEYCLDRRVVTGFIRFHPLLGNHLIGSVSRPQYVRHTVSIDLSTHDDLLAHFEGRCRTSIRKAIRSGVKISRCGDDTQSVLQFYRLYGETMTRNKASADYLYPRKFFDDTRTLLGDSCCMLAAVFQEMVVASSMVLFGRRYAHYHFSASDSRYLSYCPNNLMVYEAALAGQARGLLAFHLGGGLKEGDSLDNFKRSFSRTLLPYLVAKDVYLPKVYGSLVSDWEVARPGQQALRFPEYRCT